MAVDAAWRSARHPGGPHGFDRTPAGSGRRRQRVRAGRSSCLDGCAGQAPVLRRRLAARPEGKAGPLGRTEARQRRPSSSNCRGDAPGRRCRASGLSPRHTFGTGPSGTEPGAATGPRRGGIRGACIRHGSRDTPVPAAGNLAGRQCQRGIGVSSPGWQRGRVLEPAYRPWGFRGQFQNSHEPDRRPGGAGCGRQGRQHPSAGRSRACR